MFPVAAIVLVTVITSAVQGAMVTRASQGSYTCPDGIAGNVVNSSMISDKRMDVWNCDISAIHKAGGWDSRNPFNRSSYNPAASSKTGTVIAEFDKIASIFKPIASLIDSFTDWKRDQELCNTPCNTYCYEPGGEGPDPNDCQTLAEQDAPAGAYTLEAGFLYVWTYGTCQVTQSNLLSDTIDYCYNDWAGVVHWLAWNCQADQNASGGYCDFNNDSTTSDITLQTAT